MPRVKRSQIWTASGGSRQPLMHSGLAALTRGLRQVIETDDAERRAREDTGLSLAAFVEETTNFKLEPWQLDLSTRLQELAYTHGRRLLIHAPPQFGKSIIVSQRFPAWMLARQPTSRVKLACHNITHASHFGKITRDLM